MVIRPLVALNAKCLSDIERFRKLADVPGMCFDCAMYEGLGGIAASIVAVSAERVLFGSYLSLFPLGPSLLKLRESELTAAQADVVRQENLRRLLKS